MNILLLSTHLNTGGITSYLLTLTEGLIRQGHKVYLATSAGELLKRFQDTGAQHIQLDIKVKSELNPKVYSSLFILKRFIKDKKIDILHSQTRVTQVLGQLLSPMTQVPYIATCHGFYKVRFSRQWFPCWGDAVIAISKAVMNHLLNDFRTPSEKVFLIHNGLDVNKFKPVNDELKAQKRREFHLAEEPLIGIIARLVGVKGHEVLIKAMEAVVKKFPSTKLMIVGQGREENNLRNLAQQLNLQNNILFIPVSNQTDEILPIFDIFVLPSLDEGLGISLMEAQAVELPVIGSRIGGIVSLIEHGKTGLLVNPNDSKDLTEAIINLLENRLEAKRLGQQARIFISENFSAEQMVQKTLQVYQTVLASRQ